ncbi:Ankyrin repeat domain protein [Mycena kentingensis (nom. inval.)]|nr:Ankyrin repeat domain protein [Mycena kentingensis (nom. inval.)]
MNLFDSLPDELLLLLASELRPGALNALILTSRRLHIVLQAELDKILAENASQVLLQAAHNLKIVIVRRLLAPPFSVHPSTPHADRERTPLHAVAAAGGRKTVRALIDIAAGADVNAFWLRESRGPDAEPDAELTPLHLAASARHWDVIDLLLASGAHVDRISPTPGYRRSPLHDACATGSVALALHLLRAGADAELPGDAGTAIWYAVLPDVPNPRLVKLLLDRPVDITVRNPAGWTLLFALVASWRPAYRHGTGTVLAYRPSLHQGQGRSFQRYAAGPAAVAANLDTAALLLAYGAPKQPTMALVDANAFMLGRRLGAGVEEVPRMVEAYLRDAETRIRDVLEL